MRSTTYGGSSDDSASLLDEASGELETGVLAMSMDSLYREEILEHYKRPHNWGHLDEHDLSFKDSNPLCGDELTVEIRTTDDGRIEDLRFSGHGCAISQASASMTSDEIKGMSIDDLLKL